MGLFFELLSAINNPTQQGNIAQLSTVLNSLHQIGKSCGIHPLTMQTVMSALGHSIRPALKQQVLTTGNHSLNSWVDQFSGATLGTRAFQSFLVPELRQQIVQRIAQRTGLSATVFQESLPELLSAAMVVLSMGESQSGARASNAVLHTFLNGDRDGADLGDVFKFANRFLNPDI